MKLHQRIKSFFQGGILKDQSGQDNTEYILMSLIGVLIAVIIWQVFANGPFRAQIQRIFDYWNSIG